MMLQVKLMAREIDELMAFIEGKPASRKTETKALFTKSLMEEIESETQKLALQCQNFQVHQMSLVSLLMRIVDCFNIYKPLAGATNGTKTKYQ